ncbi:MAG TPA: hypothetical protein VFN75_08535 [Pseudonocardiaceae bacterium]|nr:hypothetical protein [Pseudonocardiaceae bacterium]
MANIDGLSQGLQELRDSIAETAQAAPRVARNEIRREGRAYFRGAVVAAVITSLLVGVPLFLLAERFSAYTNADEARTVQLQTSAADIRRLAQGAHDLGVQANAELARRGLATVPIPTPGTAPDSQVLAAASTAQVAAKIAAESIAVPTPAQIRQEIAAQLAKLPPPPVGPAPQQLDEAVQAYLAANSESLRGPRGEQGEPGKSPPCLAEPAQCQGARGEPGLRGEPPAGWTVEEADGSTTTCQRAAEFNAAAPQYRCSHAASPSPTAEPTTTSPPPPAVADPLPHPVN